MKISQKQIGEIAESLECGEKVFINRETFEIRTIFDFTDSYGDTEIFEEELEEIEREWTDYVVLSKMESWEAFKIMEAFINEIDDERLAENAVKILNRKSPFANFKYEIE